MKIAISGVSGYLGKKSVAVLEEETAVTQILGIDVAAPRFSSAKLKFTHQDIRSPDLVQVFKDAETEALLHLAWVFNPIHNYKLMYDVDVNGTRNLLTACRQAGVKHIVIVGSATCYGAYADNPEWLEEDWPLRGNIGFPYAHHKVLVERLCDEFERDNPQIALTRLRTCIVLGRNVDNFVKALVLMRGFRHVVVKGYNPAVQFLHENDFASLVRLVFLHRPRGVYNVAPDDTIPIHEALKLAGNPAIEYPCWLVRPFMALLWSIRLLPAPASYLPFIMYRWTVSNVRIKRDLGWQPRYSSRETLASMPGIANLKEILPP